MDVCRVLAAHGSLIRPQVKENDGFRIRRMPISPPYMGDAYCIRDVDANLWPKSCRIQFQPSDALHLFVCAFHDFKKGQGQSSRHADKSPWCSARDKLCLRDDLPIRHRTAWDRGIGILGKHKDNGQDKSDIFQHEGFRSLRKLHSTCFSLPNNCVCLGPIASRFWISDSRFIGLPYLLWLRRSVESSGRFALPLSD